MATGVTEAGPMGIMEVEKQHLHQAPKIEQQIHT